MPAKGIWTGVRTQGLQSLSILYIFIGSSGFMNGLVRCAPRRSAEMRDQDLSGWEPHAFGWQVPAIDDPEGPLLRGRPHPAVRAVLRGLGAATAGP